MANHDPFAALRYPEFRNLISAVFLIASAMLIQEVALGYEIYLITRDPLALGLTGLAEAVPFIGLALFGGHLADRREKRGLILSSLAVIMLGSLLLLVALGTPLRAKLTQPALLSVIYASIFLLGLARGIFSPATSSLKPFLVPRELYANSSSWSSSFWQTGAILGPASAGFMYAGFGLAGTLVVVLAMMAVAWFLLARIAARPVIPTPDHADVDIWTSLREGLDYVFRTRIMLYAISLDMFSVLFGGVVAILPIFAEDILHVGAEGLGLLRAAPAIGAVLTVLTSTVFPPTNNAWRNLLLAVTGFGIATLIFAISKNFWLSMAMLFLVGSFDSISVVIRQTIMQMMPPDHLRGRVQSVNSIFVTSSNELGAFESGLAARLLGTVPSVLMGGAFTLVVVGWIWRKSKDLLTVRLT